MNAELGLVQTGDAPEVLAERCDYLYRRIFPAIVATAALSLLLSAFLWASRPAGLPGEVVVLEPVGDADGYARHLYERLRVADAAGVDVVVAVPPASDGIGAAVLDRLRRAANARP